MKIMLIDDEPICLESMIQVLQPTGHECVAFQNPKIAIKSLYTEEYDLIVTDYKMPGMNGVEVLKKVKEIKSEARVIIITGFADTNNAMDSLNYGAYAFFCKPLNLEDFMLMINKIDRELIEHKIKEASVNQLTFEYEILRDKYNKLNGLTNNSLFDKEEKL